MNVYNCQNLKDYVQNCGFKNAWFYNDNTKNESHIHKWIIDSKAWILRMNDWLSIVLKNEWIL